MLCRCRGAPKASPLMVGGGRCGGDSREGGELCNTSVYKDQIFIMLSCAELECHCYYIIIT